MNDVTLQRRYSGFTETFLRFVAQRELRYPCCAECGRTLSFNERLCVIHPRASISWLCASGRAHIHALVEYRLAYSGEMRPPYLTAMVELAEGPRLVSTVTGLAPNENAAGQAVRAKFDTAGRLIFAIDPDLGDGGRFTK